MSGIVFWEYKLTAEMLCLGERIKKGTFRPSLKTIPSTQITGALRYARARNDVWAIGYLDKWESEYVVQAPQDVASGVSKVPLTIEVLTGVEGRVFMEGVESQEPPFRRLSLRLGALRSKGLGESELRYYGLARMEHKKGQLRSRLLEKESEKVGIKEVPRPIYGYLFEPREDASGMYSISGSYGRALLEGSIVEAYEFIVK